MSRDFESFAYEFLDRKQRNLEYFKEYRPEIYDYFHDLDVFDHELVLTPGRDDVDLTFHGQSVYRHVAKDYSVHEAKEFLQGNPNTVPLNIMPPVSQGAFDKSRMASSYMHSAFEGGGQSKFEGYWRGSAFPAVIFLGCGLGYHIEYLADNADIVNAVVFEPLKERFALTLFTVDWERICRIYRDKGYSISFCIAVSPEKENLKNVLFGKVQDLAPAYPNFCLYYNHLANVELFKIAKDVEGDLPVLFAHWGGYDFEVRGFRNLLHNVNSGYQVLSKENVLDQNLPVVIVGSGPSIDARIEDIQSTREDILLVSAGTGLRALLANGLRPDYHVEVEGDAIIYRVLGDLDNEYGLDGITLMLAISGNPGATSFFDETVFFLPANNYTPYFLGVSEHSIDHCAPTCTNAALSVFYEIGARKLYLFGTDYGFHDKEKNHSKFSIYGDSPSSIRDRKHYEHLSKMEKSRSTFVVKGVDGGEILTREDYYSAKRSVESFSAEKVKVDDSFCMFNCSDGAEIDGVEWLDRSGYVSRINSGVPQERPCGIATFDFHQNVADDFAMKLELLFKEVAETCYELRGVLDSSVIGSRDSLVVAIDRLAARLGRVGPHSGRAAPLYVQGMAWQLLKGSVKRMLQIALEQGLSQRRDCDLVSFAESWQATFQEFLAELPGHLRRVAEIPEDPCGDPWVLGRLVEPEPGWGAGNA